MRSIIRKIFCFKIVQLIYLNIFLPLLRQLPFPSTIFGPVKGIHSSFLIWLKSMQKIEGRHGESKAHWILKINSSEIIKNTPPVLTIPRISNIISQGTIHKCPEIYIAHLNWGRIATDCFEIISPDDKVFSDFFLTPPSYTTSVKSLIIPRLPRMKRKYSTYAIIISIRPDVYYRWINDYLTRLWPLELSGIKDFKLIVPKKLLPFHKQTLELLGFSTDRLAPFGEEHWCVEHLLVPSFTNAFRQSSPKACKWLRQKLISSVEAKNSFPKRIYISRILASKRRLTNEDEIVEFLKKYDFVSVLPETMPVRQQIQLFQQADVVVAPHGAGLTNILFMQEGSLVIELVHYRRIKTCYYSLANTIGVRYCCITDAPEKKKQENKRRPPDIDFIIPVKWLALAFQLLKI